MQLFLVILVSDQWRWVSIPYSYWQAPSGLLHARGWLSRYTWDQRLYVVSEPRETHSNVDSNFGSSWDRTPNLLTTRPTCYHSATALWYNNSNTLIHTSPSLATRNSMDEASTSDSVPKKTTQRKTRRNQRLDAVSLNFSQESFERLDKMVGKITQEDTSVDDQCPTASVSDTSITSKQEKQNN